MLVIRLRWHFVFAMFYGFIEYIKFKFLKFLALGEVADIVSISGRSSKHMSFDFHSNMILSHLLVINKKRESKGNQIYWKMLRKILKKEA